MAFSLRVSPRSFFRAALLAVAVGTFAVGCAPAEDDSESSADRLASSELSKEAARIRAEATELAGEPWDIPQRVVFLHEMYLDSKGNHAFPEVALHGALWAHNFFRGAELVQKVGEVFRAVHGVGGLLDTAEAFKLAIETTNRQVFIDTYTNYWFSKKYGTRPGASAFVDEDVLPTLNRIHEAAASGKPLSTEERRAGFLAALNTEQKDSVARMMDEASKDIRPAWFKEIMMRPIVRFTYFPGVKFYSFKDFSDRKDRVACATYAYDVAAEVGFEAVTDSMAEYHALPDEYFADREGYAAALRAKLLQR